MAVTLVLGLEHSCPWPQEVCPRKGCPWPWPRIFFVSLASSLVSSTLPLVITSDVTNRTSKQVIQVGITFRHRVNHIHNLNLAPTLIITSTNIGLARIFDWGGPKP